MFAERLQSLSARIVILSTPLMLAGCMATSKAWQVLKDPSLPVGLPQDQPSTIALSIVASPAMNATSESTLEPDDQEQSMAGYRIRLSSSDLRGLLGQLRMTTQTLQKELEESGELLPGPPVAASDSRADAQLESIDVVERARAVGEYLGSGEIMSPENHASTLGGEGSPLKVAVIQLKDDGVFLSLDADALWASPDRSLGKTYRDHDEFVIRPGSYKFVPFHQVKRETRFIAVAARYQDVSRVTWRAVHRIQPEGRSYPLLVELGDSGISIKSEDWE